MLCMKCHVSYIFHLANSPKITSLFIKKGMICYSILTFNSKFKESDVLYNGANKSHTFVNLHFLRIYVLEF